MTRERETGSTRRNVLRTAGAAVGGLALGATGLAAAHDDEEIFCGQLKSGRLGIRKSHHYVIKRTGFKVLSATIQVTDSVLLTERAADYVTLDLSHPDGSHMERVTVAGSAYPDYPDSDTLNETLPDPGYYTLTVTCHDASGVDLEAGYSLFTDCQTGAPEEG